MSICFVALLFSIKERHPLLCLLLEVCQRLLKRMLWPLQSTAFQLLCCFDSPGADNFKFCVVMTPPPLFIVKLPYVDLRKLVGLQQWLSNFLLDMEDNTYIQQTLKLILSITLLNVGT